MDELQRLHDSSFLVPVLGSIEVCQRALDQVTALFDTETPFIADEPLPRPLLNADLSRIPSLVMNKYGEIEGAGKPAFADSIVRLVASGAARVV